jgi:voltage-gated potassium channel
MPIKHSVFGRVRRGFRRHVAPHRHSGLLVAIVIAIAVRPLIGDTGASSTIFGVAMVFLLLVALYNIDVDELVGERSRLLNQTMWRRRLGWVLAIGAGLERVFFVFGHSPTLKLVGVIFWLLFILFVILSQLRSVLRQRVVTGETICTAVSVYLLLGFGWALLYGIMYQLHPDSFAGLALAKPSQPAEALHVLPILGYFSLTTLSTIGFGDITPVTLQARYVAVAEGITGQFYLAILVARLVGLQMSGSTGQHTEKAAHVVGLEESGSHRRLASE